MKPEPARHHVEELRRHRTRPDPDLSLGFLKKQFEREIAKPARHLAAVVELWNELVPEALRDATRLESLARGVLHVTVNSSVELYELDGLLRSGLERELIRRHRGPAFRKIKLKVGPIDGPAADRGQRRADRI
jgi:hypothetical protein